MYIREYLAVLRERWLIVLLGLALGVGLGGAAAFLRTPQYAANVEFFISTPDRAKDLNQAYQGSLLSEQKIKSYVKLARDRRIRQQVAEQLHSPVAPGAISASAAPDTVLLTLTATDPSPVRAQQLAAAAASAFAGLVSELERPTSGAPVVVTREIQDAQVPIAPISPRQKPDLILGLFLGLVLGIVAAVLRHNLDRSVKSTDELADLVQAPVLPAACAVCRA